MTNLEKIPTQEYLQECFEYIDGALFWKERPLSHFKTEAAMYSCNSKLSGKKAGVSHNGYIDIGLNKTNFKAHILIWKFNTGNNPSDSIYHLNGDISDNKIENLADGDMQDIGKIKLMQANNTSGTIGVYFNKHQSNWYANITRNNVNYHLGNFDSIEEAITARKKAESESDLSNYRASSKKKLYEDILITKDIVDMLLRYDDGKLFWKERFVEGGYYSAKSCRTFNSQHAGKEAGALDTTYLKVELFGKKYKIHRLVWLMFNGTDPKKLIDHIDGNKLNNKIENLREADYVTNGMNRKSHYNKVLPKGVSFNKRFNRYIARIMTDGKSKYLGWFNDIESAKLAYDTAAIKYHGVFANLGDSNV
jgi:hypothetical protein